MSRPAPKRDAVRALLLADPDRRLSDRDIQARTGASRGTVYATIRDLLADGSIARRSSLHRAASKAPAIAAALAAGESVRSITRRFDVGESYVYHIRRDAQAERRRRAITDG